MRTLDEMLEVARELLTGLAEAEGFLALVAAEARAAQEVLVAARIELERVTRPAPGTEADNAEQLVPALAKAARAADDVRARFVRIAAAVWSRQPPAGSRPT